ncbi:MAG: DUF2905 domain-containing protein [Desulfomonilia bacterium]
MKDMSILLIIVGIICILLGLVFSFGLSIPWLGRLPGDIRIVRPGFSVYIPITTSILVSIVLSVLFILFRYFR